MIDTLLLLAGLALIVFGAEYLVDGASAIARKAGISEFVIGLTIVGFGTSMPELVVSINGAISGISDISIGNVVGSNIFNVLLILGFTAVVMPVSISRQNKLRDIPITLLVTFILIFFGMNHSLFGIGSRDGLSRIEGIAFIALFALYIFYCFRTDVPEESADGNQKTVRLLPAVIYVAAGLAGLVFGGKLFVNSATSIARTLGVSDKFIAITVLAGGTSLPELATCIVAALKKKDQLALGNILGSNVFNILLILGCSAAITPLSFAGMDMVDMAAMLVSVILVWIGAYTFQKDKLDRGEGIILLLCFAAYYVWLFQKL